MTKQETSKCYQIPTHILDEYESWCLCGVVKKVMGVWQYDDEDLERLGLIMSLHDIGFTVEEVERYMRFLLEEQGGEQKCLRMLNCKRNMTLDEIHFWERQLARLDYLRHEIEKGNTKGRD